MTCGLPASGKSTARRDFEAFFPDYTIISSDDLVDLYARKHGLSYQDAYAQHAVAVKELITMVAADAFHEGYDVFWDQTNLTVEARASILQMVPDHYQKLAAVFEIGEDEQAQRIAFRDTLYGKNIPPEILAKMRENFIHPTTSEGFDSILSYDEFRQFTLGRYAPTSSGPGF
jgi:predicted kinase